MNDAFPRLLTLLRKERGYSQKKVAADLDISQALLSHYEKGIRECGLDFVVKTADYYNVSCDYLLGRTADRSGAVINAEDIPENDPEHPDNQSRGSVVAVLNKKLLLNSLQILFDLLQEYNCKALTNEVSAYLSLAMYNVFRILYSANPKNPAAFFSAEEYRFRADLIGHMCLSASNAEQLASGHNIGDLRGADVNQLPIIVPDAISEKYPLFATSLMNLLHNAEEKMK